MNTFIVRIQFVWTGTAANRRREGEEMLHGEQRRGGSAARTGRVVVLGRVVTRVALAMSHVMERHIYSRVEQISNGTEKGQVSRAKQSSGEQIRAERSREESRGRVAATARANGSNVTERLNAWRLQLEVRTHSLTPHGRSEQSSMDPERILEQSRGRVAARGERRKGH